MLIKIIFLFLLNFTLLIDGKLTFSDEFNDAAGSPPSKDNWNYDLGDGTANGIPGWGNNELEYYTDSRNNSATDGEGHLVITANRDNSGRKCYYGDCAFTSARLVSKFAQAYGRFEVRVKTPAGKGIWPAFWMLGQNIKQVGWPTSGEIDILELRGSAPNKVNAALHGPGFSGGDAISWQYTSKTTAFNEDFHVIALDWTPDSLKWSADGDVYATITPSDLSEGKSWVFNKPAQMLLNLAIGGHYDGNPVDNETFPKKYYIDYVRVYDLEEEHNIAVPEIRESMPISSGIHIFNYFKLTFYTSLLSIIFGYF